MGNIIGDLYKVVTFGESHGKCIGCVIDGCPSGFLIDLDFIQLNLNNRRPGTSRFVTQRLELDLFDILSGVFNGYTTGTPLSVIVKNTGFLSKDYNNIGYNYRPGHADFTYFNKYGIYDFRGGGRSSARTTIALVIAGSLARQINMSYFGVDLFCYLYKIGYIHISYVNRLFVCCNNFFLPNLDVLYSVKKYLSLIKNSGDSIGACLILVISNVLYGLGEPLYNKFTTELTSNLVGLNAVKSVCFGLGKYVYKYKGSFCNDFIYDKGFLSNNSGGILGGITSGQDVYVKVYIKPTASISFLQKTVDNKLNNSFIKIFGRHDPCVGVRAVTIIESIASIVLINLFLRQKLLRFF